MKKVLITIVSITAIYFYTTSAIKSQKLACVDELLNKNISIELKKERLNKFIVSNPNLKDDAIKMSLNIIGF